MAVTIIALLIAVVLCHVLCCTAHRQTMSTVYYVIPCHEVQPQECTSNVTCHTLDEYIAQGTFNTSHAKFVFLNGTHHLTKSLMVYDSEHLTLQRRVEGNNSVQVVCQSRWTVALSFTRVTFLTIQNISFINCSYNNTFAGPENSEYTISALYFEGGSDLTLSGVRIVNGGFSIINMHGQVEITRTNITSNMFFHHSGKTQSFGGSLVKFFSCETQLILTILESKFDFYNTTFLNHTNLQKTNGLCMSFSCSNLSVLVKKSIFYGFQHFGRGGNFVVLLQKYQYIPSNKTLIEIRQCQFVNGQATKGGGAFIQLEEPHYFENKNTPANFSTKALKISGSNFTNNTAQGGGAINLILKEYSRSHTIVSVHIERCNFIGNYLETEESHGGIAIQVSTFLATPSTSHYFQSFETTIEDCSFQSNYIFKDYFCSPGNGVITVVRSSKIYIHNSQFTQNNCTAIKAIASNLLLEGQVDITNNHGSSGGGLLLCDDSVIIFKPNTRVQIINNKVQHTGGGITVESQCLQSKPMCFFQLSEEIAYNNSLLDTVEVVLANNSAKYAGDNLFGGSVDYCYLIHYEDKNLVRMDVFNKLFLNLTWTSVTSAARTICFCDGLQKDCSSKKTKYVKVYPGETFHVSAVPVGQLNGTVPASIRANSSAIRTSEKTQYINGKCQNLNYTVMSNKTHQYIKLHIQHEHDISGYIKSSLFKSAKIYVRLKQCPIGFELNNLSKCACDKVLYLHSPNAFVSCSIKKKTIKKPHWLWIGYMPDPYESNKSSERYLAIRHCLLDYCDATQPKNKVNVIEMKKNELAEDIQCQFNRTGILCGACAHNLSMILGSSGCWPCSNKSLVLLFVFAFAGVMLTIFLTLCNLTVAGGKITGLIFFANILHISDTLFIPADIPILSSIFKTIIAWVNLDLGIYACFYNGMDAYAKAWLQFAFPLYLWILSGLIVFLCNRYISVTRLFGTNSVRVLATVILLSFTKLLRAVTTALACVQLVLHEQNGTKPRALWMSDPNILCLRGKHIPLFIFGFIIGIVWLIFIVFMLFIQCWPRLRCCSWIQQLKPFTDSFTGPNTSHGRFWTGLLLLSRTVIATAYGFLGNGTRQSYYFASVALVSICLLQISACLPSGVYIKRSNNTLETFFLRLLLIVACFAGLRLENYFVCTSVAISLVIFAYILIYHCWYRLKNTRGVAVLRMWMSRIKVQRRKQVEESESIVIDGPTHPTYCTFDQDREPLLASLASYH